MTENRAHLAAALANVQSQLPTVGKAQTANAGTYTYHYADLAAVSKAVLPLLGKNGLAWITKPTYVDGRFVLAYKLRHGPSGEEETGEYPLPDRGSPQQIGSAITYARRYCLCSVTGVAPESDDDDAKAASTRQPDEWEAATPATAGQARVFDDFAKQIKEAPSPDAITEIGKSVHIAKASNAISKAQYDQLSTKAAARRAELEASGG